MGRLFSQATAGRKTAKLHAYTVPTIIELTAVISELVKFTCLPVLSVHSLRDNSDTKFNVNFPALQREVAEIRAPLSDLW